MRPSKAVDHNPLKRVETYAATNGTDVAMNILTQPQPYTQKLDSIYAFMLYRQNELDQSPNTNAPHSSLPRGSATGSTDQATQLAQYWLQNAREGIVGGTPGGASVMPLGLGGGQQQQQQPRRGGLQGIRVPTSKRMGGKAIVALGRQVSPVVMAFIQNHIEPQVLEQTSIYTDEVLNPGMTFRHPTRTLKKRYETDLIAAYTHFGKEWQRYQLKFGIALYKFKPDPRFIQLPCILDPMAYNCYYARNQFNELVWTIYDMEGNERQDIFVDCLYEPQADGQLTSPMYRLIDAYISNIIVRAELEQTNAQQIFPNLILEDHSNPLAWQDQDPDAPGAGNVIDVDASGNLGTLGTLAALTAPSTNMARGPGGDYAANSAIDGVGRGGPPVSAREQRYREIVALQRSRQGRSVFNDSTDMMLNTINDVINSALLTRPPTAADPHAVYSVSNGWVLRTMQSPNPPHNYHGLIDEYIDISYRVFGLPNLSQIGGQRQMVKEESQFMSKQKKQAVFNMAFWLNDLLRRILAHVFGTMDTVMDIVLKLHQKNSALQAIQTIAGQPGVLDDDSDDEGGDASSSSEDDTDTVEESRLVVPGTTPDTTVSRKRKQGRGGGAPAPKRRAPARSKKLRDIEVKQNQIFLIHESLEENTIPVAEDGHVNPVSGLASTQARSQATDGESSLEQDQARHVGQGGADSTPATRNPAQSMTNMATQMESLRQKATLKQHVSQGRWNRAFVEDERSKLLRLMDFLQDADEASDNSAGLSVQLNFLRDFERDRWNEKNANNETNLELLQAVVVRMAHLQDQLAQADEVLQKAGHTQLAYEREHFDPMSPAAHQAVMSMQTPEDIIQAARQIVGVDAQADPLRPPPRVPLYSENIPRLDPRPMMNSRLVPGGRPVFYRQSGGAPASSRAPASSAPSAARRRVGGITSAVFGVDGGSSS